MIHLLALFFTFYVISAESMDISTRMCRIVGGKNADIAMLPFQVSLEVKVYKNFIHVCGGAIIAKPWALTAAHCVFGIRKEKLRIRSGTSKRSSGGNIHNIIEYVMHPKYDNRLKAFDIAAVKVQEQFQSNFWENPVRLAQRSPRPGTEAIVSGWGQIIFEGPCAEVLQYVYVTVLNASDCRSVYLERFTVDMLCAGHPPGGKDACLGDSGGPLIVDDELVGIVSWGTDCARPNYPGVYADIAHFRPWIINVTKTRSTPLGNKTIIV